MPNSTDVKYLNKDFSSFKSDLIEYAKSYYPTVYNDFTQASPGSMFIEMAAYVGDVLSFYLDNQLQETFLQYAKQKGNLYSMAYMLGYIFFHRIKIKENLMRKQKRTHDFTCNMIFC